ncbi:MAG: hypothetical protein LBR26_17420 [Prevotella sp.]|jgi:hypothetical protein|nr:hypothetical protein [Prevotella sp.]
MYGWQSIWIVSRFCTIVEPLIECLFLSRFHIKPAPFRIKEDDEPELSDKNAVIYAVLTLVYPDGDTVKPMKREYKQSVMKTLTIILLFLVFSSFAGSDKQSPTKKQETTVLICTGKYSKRYHSFQCKGMNTCKGEQKKVSLATAKEMGRTPCKYCYK